MKFSPDRSVPKVGASVRSAFSLTERQIRFAIPSYGSYNTLDIDDRQAGTSPVIRKSFALSLAAALLYSAMAIYTENGYGGMQADFSLLKYIAGIDGSGGVLEEHVSSYMEDRVSSILIAMLLAVASFWSAFKGFSRKENARGADEEG